MVDAERSHLLVEMAALELELAGGVRDVVVVGFERRDDDVALTLRAFKKIGIANATADVSDGLLADAGHIAEASRLAVEIARERVPLSSAARRAENAEPALWANVLGGGDDFSRLIVWTVRLPRATAAFAVGAFVIASATSLTNFTYGYSYEVSSLR